MMVIISVQSFLQRMKGNNALCSLLVRLLTFERTVLSVRKLQIDVSTHVVRSLQPDRTHGGNRIHDEDIAYAEQLAKAGVPVELHVHPRTPHGCERFAPNSKLAKRAMNDRMR